MSAMSLLYLGLFIIATLVVVRAILLLFSAEMGRRHDLVKPSQHAGTDFYMALVVPYLDANAYGSFQDLLKALSAQDYPVSRTQVHIIATEDTVFGMPMEDNLPPHFKVWTYAAKQTTRGECVSWLVERLLAAGGPTRLFVFLEPDDIVRPDFLRHVAAKAFDCFAMQGYVALKRPPKTMLATVASLSTRLINRIENAGRFHMGLSCTLMNSGWVVRQELLEMIPFRQGQDMDNLEYTTLLNLNGYRVHWAPNVVVYRDEKVSFGALMKTIAHSTLNRVRLSLQYSLPLLVQSISHLELGALDQLWGILKPPNFVLGALGIVIAASLMADAPIPGSFYYWSLLTGAFLGTQLVGLAVARCRFQDAVFFLAGTPMVYALGGLAFPLFLVNAVAEQLLILTVRPKASRVGRRFDESRPAQRIRLADRLNLPEKTIETIESIIEQDATLSSRIDARHRITTTPTASKRHLSGLPAREPSPLPLSKAVLPAPDAAPLPGPHAASALPQQTRSVLPITNGKNAVDTVVRTFKTTDAGGTMVYHLVLEYKDLSFTTQKYRILDQAYYELETKLKGKGFSMVSCGSCAYFYRPTAGNSYGVAKDCGFCLYGKEGCDVNLDQDAVTVVSTACPQYTDMEHRAKVLQQWQETLVTTQRAYSTAGY